MAYLPQLAQALRSRLPLEEAFPNLRTDFQDDLLMITNSCFLERARVLMTVMRPLKERRI